MLVVIKVLVVPVSVLRLVFVLALEAALVIVLVLALESALVWLLVGVVPYTFSQTHPKRTAASGNLRNKGKDENQGKG